MGGGPQHSDEVEEAEVEAAGMPDKVEDGSGKESGEAEKTGAEVAAGNRKIDVQEDKERKTKIRSWKRQSGRRAAKLKMERLRPRQCLIK